MKILTLILDMFTVILRLLEAEARVLRRAVMNVGWLFACIAIASMLVVVAAGIFLSGMYQFLSSQMSPVAASFLVAFLALMLALIFAGIAKWMTADRK